MYLLGNQKLQVHMKVQKKKKKKDRDKKQEITMT